METQAATNVTGHLATIGTAGKTFILAHPMGMAITGGALLGIGAYYTTSKLFKKKTETQIEKEESEVQETAVAA
ncbi:MAG: Unknown protein [uncultured Thiotrichaceae bacterium]|uniref:Uncharacterized protein n=1 Tax=uncultured Thiotrichaceae bacterium TaxID=298394 RepID=A0A6S6UI84_9GAMM|nr:MAG: Unknown protein [uncultured Thiotrichaceae bacterium]